MQRRYLSKSNLPQKLKLSKVSGSAQSSFVSVTNQLEPSRLAALAVYDDIIAYFGNLA